MRKAIEPHATVFLGTQIGCLDDSRQVHGELGVFGRGGFFADVANPLAIGGGRIALFGVDWVIHSVWASLSCVLRTRKTRCMP